jgi:hypothetical protein
MKSLAALGILAVAGSAMAAPFRALSYEAGGGVPGIAGMGFSVSSGGFFVADGAGGNIDGGGAANFTTANEQEFDSRFSLSGFGPTARNRSVTPGNNSTATLMFYGNYGAPGAAAANWDELESTAQNGFGPFHQPGAAFIIGPGSHIGDPMLDGSNPENQARAGIAVSPPPVESHFAPNATGGRSANDGIFVGRFTVKDGATLSGGLFFNTFPMPGSSDGHDLVLGGGSVAFMTHNGVQNLVLRSYKVADVSLTTPSIATIDGGVDGNPFGAADVYDLWVHTAGGPPPNEAPLVDGLPDENCYTVNVGDTLNDVLSLLGPEAGQTVTGVLQDLNGAQAAGLSAIFGSGPDTLTLNWTPDAGDVGVYNFVLDLTDSLQGTSSTTFQIKVIPTPGAFALIGLSGLAAIRRRRA